jgi:5'-3' exonuclease
MRILLDADMLLFRVASATEVEVQLGDDVWTRHSELGTAREMYWDQLKLWCDLYDCTFDDVWHCFTDRSAFRRDLFPGYKASRKGVPKPIGFKQLKSELMTETTAFMFHQIEADDLIGIFASMPSMGDEVVIASGDKDLLQVPGVHIWMDTGKEQQDEAGLSISYANGSIIKTNTVEHAERFTYKQYLSGDSTDGVPGCPSIGDKRASDIVASFNINRPVDCWKEIVRTYETKGKVEQPSDFATQQARLVRVLRAGEYDFSTHTVNLWNPPTR